MTADQSETAAARQAEAATARPCEAAGGSPAGEHPAVVHLPSRRKLASWTFKLDAEGAGCPAPTHF